MYYVFKIIITTILIVAISEVSKRSTMVGAILASIPLVSVMAFVWIYIDTKDVEKIAGLSEGIFWLVLPSLVLFIAMSLLLKNGFGFYLSLGLSMLATAISYFVMIFGLKHFGVDL